jgi:hypothetical protein
MAVNRAALPGEELLNVQLRDAIVKCDIDRAIGLCRQIKLKDNKPIGVYRHHCTPLHLAVSCGDAAFSITRALVLEFDFGPHVELEEIGCPLHMAARQGDAALLTLRFLLTCRTVDVQKCITSYSSQTALGIACEGKHIETINVLLTKGAACPCAEDGSGQSAYDYACGHREAYALLLKFAPQPFTLSIGTLTTLISKADAHLVADTLALLTDKRRRELLHSTSNGMTPLMCAAYHGYDVAIVDVLLKHGGWLPTHKRLGLDTIQVSTQLGHSRVAAAIQAFVDQ